MKPYDTIEVRNETHHPWIKKVFLAPLGDRVICADDSINIHITYKAIPTSSWQYYRKIPQSDCIPYTIDTFPHFEANTSLKCREIEWNLNNQDKKNWYTITRVHNNGIYNHNGRFYKWETALKDLEWLRPDFTTIPFGIQVETKTPKIKYKKHKSK